MATTTAYLQLQADYYSNGERVRQVKAVAVTQRPPTNPRSGSRVVKLQLDVPDAAFLPLSPSATVVIPESLVWSEPVVVEAVEQ